MVTAVDIDPALVERYILDLATFGADASTGVSRPAYSAEWLAAQNQYKSWCVEAGLQAQRDAVGNVWGVLPGVDPGPSIVTGSHVDSQCPGGRYDGALGAIAGLVALRALREQFGPPKRTLEALSMCEEESSRFPGANFWGSRALTGQISRDEADTLQDYDGHSIGAAMSSVGLDPDRIDEAKRDDIDTFVELHIEQGPILEHAGLPVGIVTGITGIRHTVLTVHGRADHAGAAPMDLRVDPIPAVAEIASGVIAIAREMGRPAVTTVGRIVVEPNLPAIVPEKVTFTIDARHPDDTMRDALYRRHREIIDRVAAATGLRIETRVVMDQAPCPCDPRLVQIVQQAADEVGIPTMLLHSGAGHDTQVMARLAKVQMIFVRSKGGRSHTPAEFTSTEDATLGIRLLASTILKLAY